MLRKQIFSDLFAASGGAYIRIMLTFGSRLFSETIKTSLIKSEKIFCLRRVEPKIYANLKF